MITLQYASDLHLEFRDNTTFLEQHPLSVCGDILILAGDIILLAERKLEKHPFFDWCASHYKETYIIPGNHEYYSKYELADTLNDFEYNLRDNVRYINNKSIRFDDTELFFSTLWSPVKENEILPVQMGLTDCLRIIYQGRRFTSQDYKEVYKICFDWLSNSLKESVASKKIVITHHCPTSRFRDPRFIESNINSAFCVSLDEFIEKSDIDYWIFGHTHFNGGSDTRIGSTILLSNQLGYVKYGEMEGFCNDANINFSLK